MCVMFCEYQERILKTNTKQTQKTHTHTHTHMSKPASQPVAKPERMCWSKPEHIDIKQSKTKAQWNQTIRNRSTVKSSNPKPSLFHSTAVWFLTVWFHFVLAWDCLISLCFGLGLFDFTVFWFLIVWFHFVLVLDCLISVCFCFGLFDFSVFWFQPAHPLWLGDWLTGWLAPFVFGFCL